MITSRRDMLEQGSGWVGSSRNQICGWAFGFAKNSSDSPLGFAITLNTLHLTKEFKVAIYKIADNPYEIKPEELFLIKEFFYKKNYLGIHSEKQEIVFPLNEIEFYNGYTYLITIEADNLLGCSSSYDDLPEEDYLARGYFKQLGKPIYRHVASHHSIARRIIWPIQGRNHRNIGDNLINALRAGMFALARDCAQLMAVVSLDKKLWLEDAKLEVLFFRKDEALAKLKCICQNFIDYNEARYFLLEAFIIFNMLQDASNYLNTMEQEGGLLGTYKPCFLTQNAMLARASRAEYDKKSGLALTLYKFCFKFWPTDDEIWKLLFNSLLNLHKWASLSKFSKLRLEYDCRDEYAILGKALGEWHTGHKESAKESLTLLASFPEISEGIAVILSKNNYSLINPDDALKIIKKILAQGTVDINLARTVFWLESEIGNKTIASKDFLKYIGNSIHPNSLTNEALYDILKLYKQLEYNVIKYDNSSKFVDYIIKRIVLEPAPIGLHASYTYISFLKNILDYMPSNSIEIVFDKPSEKLTEYIKKYGLNRFKIIYGYANLKKYNCILADHSVCQKFPDKRTIAFPHGTDGYLTPKIYDRISSIIYQFESVAKNGVIPITSSDNYLKESFTGKAITEIAYTGPFHTDTKEFINKDKNSIRREVEDKYKIVIDQTKPVILFLTDELCLPTHISYCVKQLSKYCTVLFKPWFQHPSYNNLPKSVIIISNMQMSNNLLRFGSDFIFCSFCSGTVMSSIMLGLPIITYYSRALKIQNPGYEYTTPELFDIWNDRHGIYEVDKGLSKSTPKNKLTQELLKRGFLFDLLDTGKLKKAILDKEYMQHFNYSLPIIQKKIFGDYMKNGSAKKTAELILRMARTGSFGEDCTAIHIKNLEYLAKSIAYER